MDVVGLGAGGHAKVVAEALRLSGEHRLVGLLDPDPSLHGREVGGVPVLGDDSMLARLRDNGVAGAIVTLGTVLDGRQRRRLFELAVRHGFQPALIVHPQATLSYGATIGPGAVVLTQAVVNVGAEVRENVIINTGAIIEHDCRVGAHAHVASGARLAGKVDVGEEALIGMGACILQGISIGRRAIVGAGAVVLRDVPDGATVVGVPARLVRTAEP